MGTQQNRDPSDEAGIQCDQLRVVWGRVHRVVQEHLSEFAVLCVEVEDRREDRIERLYGVAVALCGVESGVGCGLGAILPDEQDHGFFGRSVVEQRAGCDPGGLCDVLGPRGLKSPLGEQLGGRPPDLGEGLGLLAFAERQGSPRVQRRVACPIQTVRERQDYEYSQK